MNENQEQFIITFDGNDAFASLISDEFYKRLVITNKQNNKDPEFQIFLHKYFLKNSNFEITWDDYKHTCKIKHTTYEETEDKINENNIVFDRNSAASFKKFKETLSNYMKTENTQIFYNSDNLKYIGPVKNSVNDDFADLGQNVPHGKGVLFYDFDENELKSKYSGSFNEGQYDGNGIFYDETNYISIEAPNISNGIPQRKINIKYDKKSKEVDVKDIWDQVGYNRFSDSKEIYEYVSSDDFVKEVAYMFIDNKELDEYLFNNRSINDRIKYLKDINEYLEIKQDELSKDIYDLKKELYNFRFISIFSTCILGFIIFFK